MLATEFCIPPPAVCLAINSSGVTPEYSEGESTPMGVQAPPYCGGVEQPEEERNRLLSVEVAFSKTVFQVRVCDGVIVEIIRVGFELYKKT